MAGEGEQQQDEVWRKDTFPRVLALVSTRLRLSLRDVYSLLLVSPSCYRSLLSHPTPWQHLDLREMNKAGEKLISALSLSRYNSIREINLEFAQDVEDKHLIILKNKFSQSLQFLESLNLNGCQKIFDEGVEAITYACPNLKTFSIYWNVRITDSSVKHLVKSCKGITNLNLSGCKSISDQSLYIIAENYKAVDELNLTRCIKLTDAGLQQILLNCFCLRSLNLYALSSFTDKAYKNLSFLKNLRFLDLCGAQNLTDEGLSSISACKDLVSLNLTWCVRVTDVGILAVAQGCKSLELLSLFGIVGVTDKCLKALSNSCSRTLTTLDVNGCVGIKRRSHEELLQLFPYLHCFKVKGSSKNSGNSHVISLSRFRSDSTKKPISEADGADPGAAASSTSSPVA
ncbi:hypothetical protein Taro_026799 [Colocasia esculenta]|uniref:F-box/LRR-repeat protein 15-like leucin rich repeat domain-containing protein n=1 Tax=Colocasia esculenta TaxID=4460 RepID=A0A843VG86_COLES|nr:hypothetical protein [Colocasia esculenta]